MLQTMGPQEFLKLHKEGCGGERGQMLEAYSKDGVVYEDKNEERVDREDCERVYSDWQLYYSG